LAKAGRLSGQITINADLYWPTGIGAIASSAGARQRREQSGNQAKTN